jgi:hypothetical protein
MSNERAKRELDEMFEAFIKPVRKESTEGVEWLRPLTGRQYWHIMKQHERLSKKESGDE